MKRNLILFIIFELNLITLSGCASIVNGTQQKITIDTSPVAGAQCYLQNDKGKWYLNNTPGTVTVHRSSKELLIKAQKPGFQETTMSVDSKTKGMVFGNAIFGGGIGAGIDCINGSAYDYPTTIHVSMVPLSEKQSKCSH